MLDERTSILALGKFGLTDGRCRDDILVSFVYPYRITAGLMFILITNRRHRDKADLTDEY